MRKKRLGVWGLALVMGISLMGCGGGAGKDSAESEKKESSGSGEKQVVKCIIQGEGFDKYFHDMAKQLEEKDSPYTYDIECVSLDNLDEKINLAHASGDDYDFIMVNNSSVLQFFNAGVLAPLDDFMAAHTEIKENYGESLLNVGVVEGTSYAIPIAPGSRILAYNKKLLEDAGYSAPTSQEEIMEIAKALSKDGVYAFARQMDTSLAPAYVEGCFWMANGAAIAKEEDGKILASCDSPEMISSVKWWRDMTEYMPDDINMSASQVRAMFEQDQLLFYVFGPWEFTQMSGMEYGVDYELMLTPGSKGYGSTLGGWYVGVGADSDCKEGALAMIEQSILPENIVVMNEGVPADNRCYDMEPFNSEQYKVFMESMEYTTVPFPITANFNEINDVFFEYFNACLMDDSDIEEKLKECNEKIQGMLDEE